MDDYTPSTEDVRESYTYFRGTIPTVEHAAEFDRWLLRVQAAAWEVGAGAGYVDALLGQEPLRNPYTLTTEDVRGVTLAGP